MTKAIESDRMREFGNAPLGKLLWKYSLPAVVGTVVMSLYHIIKPEINFEDGTDEQYRFEDTPPVIYPMASIRAGVARTEKGMLKYMISLYFMEEQGVNIGGVGTLIASLASLITFREYTKQNKGKTRYYILLFSAFNFAFLIILTLLMLLLGSL